MIAQGHGVLMPDILSAEPDTLAPVRHHRAYAVPEPGRQPYVLGVGMRDPGLLPQDLNDRGDAAEGEAAVAAEAGVGRPGGADVVVLQPAVEGVEGVGAEDACEVSRIPSFLLGWFSGVMMTREDKIGGLLSVCQISTHSAGAISVS